MKLRLEFEVKELIQVGACAIAWATALEAGR
mgnify:CR=1 FL=1